MDNERENNPLYIRAKEAMVSLPTVYKRMREIYEKEGIIRIPTVDECKLRKAGRKRKYNY